MLGGKQLEGEQICVCEVKLAPKYRLWGAEKATAARGHDALLGGLSVAGREGAYGAGASAFGAEGGMREIGGVMKTLKNFR
jgi:hypothetical protein